MIKITRTLYARIHNDLHRSHPFACERVGFILCRSQTVGRDVVFYGFDYVPVADSDYIDDETVGARINGNAIRNAMGFAITRQCSVFHVHSHRCSSRPGPSQTDRNECPGIARSMHNAFPRAPHGWLILGTQGVFAEVITTKTSLSCFDDMVIVGLPMMIPVKEPLRDGLLMRGRRSAANQRYDRQGFLGVDANARIENTRIGIVGLGGGGSHVIQQLVHLGFRRLVLCDPDNVEFTNLNRLIGATRHDARRKSSKVDVAVRTVRNLHKTTDIRLHATTWQSCMHDIADCDIVVGCVDSFEQRHSLDAFCRRNFIPYVDIGMEVRPSEDAYHEIYGQVVLSLPGHACLQCAGVITDNTLGREVQNYGKAGPQPQVVWPNGVLASSAVGHCVSLVTGWSGKEELPVRVDYLGSTGTVAESAIWKSLRGIACPHYPLDQAGESIYRKL